MDLNRPIIRWGGPFDESTQDPMSTHSFFFSFESALPERDPRPASGGLTSLGRPGLKKSLEVPVFIVQNGRAWS